MSDSIKVAISDFPEEFTQSIHNYIRIFSITILIADELDSPDVTPCSGTLCQCGNKSGIITARHVWEEAKKHKYLVIMTERGPLPIKTQDLFPSVVPDNSTLKHTPVKVPDIAFINLDPQKKIKIESMGKVFYSVKKRASFLPHELNLEDGYWSIFGNPQTLLDVNERTLRSLIYGTNIDFISEQDGWDYLFVNLDINHNPGLPRDFGGVSGGGVWRTMWSYDTKDKRYRVSNLSEDCLLLGMSFYQTAGDESKIIAHGPNSIYKKLVNFI